MDYRTPPNSPSLPCRPVIEIQAIINTWTPRRLAELILGSQHIDPTEQRERYLFRELSRLRARELRDAGQL